MTDGSFLDWFEVVESPAVPDGTIFVVGPDDPDDPVPLARRAVVIRDTAPEQEPDHG